jgi:hypothetical protein
MVPATLLSPRDERSKVGRLPPTPAAGSSSQGRRGRGSTARTGFSWRTRRPAAVGPAPLLRDEVAAGVCSACGAAVRSGAAAGVSGRAASGVSLRRSSGVSAAVGGGVDSGALRGASSSRGAIVGSGVDSGVALGVGVGSGVGVGVASGVGVGVAFGVGVGVVRGVGVGVGAGTAARSAGIGDLRRIGAAASCAKIAVVTAKFRQAADRKSERRCIVRGGKSRSPGW